EVADGPQRVHVAVVDRGSGPEASGRPADVALPVGAHVVRVFPLFGAAGRVETGDRLGGAVRPLGPRHEHLAFRDRGRTPSHPDLRLPEDGGPGRGPFAETVLFKSGVVVWETPALGTV